MKIAVFPGSFDPVTNGHLDLIRRASRIFDRLIVMVSINLSKNYLFPLNDRVRLIRQDVKNLPNVKVVANNQLTVKMMKRLHSHIIVRGIRNGNDLNYEKSVALINHHLDHRIETVFLAARPQYESISSSILKETDHFGGDISAYVPQNVMKRLRERHQ